MTAGAGQNDPLSEGAPPITRVLATSPFFRGLREDWLRRLAAAARPLTCPADRELRLEDAAVSMIVAGEVAVSLPLAGGHWEIVQNEGPGRVLAGPGLTGDTERRRYRALGDVDLYAWDLAALEELSRSVPGLDSHLRTRLAIRARRHELLDLLRRTRIFSSTGQSLLCWLLESATLARFDAGTVIVRQGEPGEEFFLIVSGQVAIERAVADDRGAQRRVAVLGPGDCFGEMALLLRAPRSASAVAETDCEALVVDRGDFEVLRRRSASFRRSVHLVSDERVEASASGRTEPELVWLVNRTRCSSDVLARLLAEALGAAAERLATVLAVRSPRDLEATAFGDAEYVVCHGEQAVERSIAERLGDTLASVVFFTDDPERPFPYAGGAPQKVYRVEVPVPDGAVPAGTLYRGAFRVPLEDVAPHSRLADLPEPASAALARVARAVARRRVGLALGGGAAWGWAHVALLRGLHRAGIPVDVLIGVSMGSLVGAFYASMGLAGLDQLVAARRRLATAALASLVTSTATRVFVDRHLSHHRLEELPLDFATVAVDVETGAVRVFTRGAIGDAVRASCSLPGVFGPSVIEGARYVDGCVKNNVPASHCIEAGADFVIACNVVPSPRSHPAVVNRSPIGALAARVTGLTRIQDTVRSVYMLVNDTGNRQASMADATFAPDLGDFLPWDFLKAEQIIAAAERLLPEWLAVTAARYRALSRGRSDDA